MSSAFLVGSQSVLLGIRNKQNLFQRSTYPLNLLWPSLGNVHKWISIPLQSKVQISLRSRRKRGRGRGARTREKNGGLGARDEGTPANTPATKTFIFSFLRKILIGNFWQQVPRESRNLTRTCLEDFNLVVKLSWNQSEKRQFRALLKGRDVLAVLPTG